MPTSRHTLVGRNPFRPTFGLITKSTAKEHRKALMADKNIPWTGDFSLGTGEPLSPAEQAFLKEAEQIALEVAEMSDADVSDYLVEHNLQDLVAPERVEALLASALKEVRQRQAAGPIDTGPDNMAFAVRAQAPGSDETQAPQAMAAGGNVVRPAFGTHRNPTR